MALTPAELIYGPIFLGVVINILLYGIMTTQTYLYFATFRNDRLWMKVFVGVLFVADTANTVFDTVFLYERLIANYNNPTKLGSADWIFNTDPALTAIIAFLVQSFFAWRVKIVTGSIWALAGIMCCSCAQLLGGLATAIACGIVTQFQEFHKFQSVVIVWLVGAAVADVAIAIALVSHLRTHRTGFVATDDIITRLTRMTVSTGAITAVCATVDLIAFLASTSGLHLVFNMPLAKLYTNSLLSSLNSRRGGHYSESASTKDGGYSRNTGIGGGRRPDVLELQTGGKHPNAVNVTVTRSVDIGDGGAIPAKMYPADSEDHVDTMDGKDAMV